MDRAEAEAILDGERETAIALLMRLDELIAANRRLEARVADLERQLNRTSRNSSLPPSLDPPSAPPRPRPPLSGRSPGGQPGHEAKNRRLLPLERVDEVVDHWPQRCQACARPFSANERWDAATPQRHQVAELPEVALTVSEHRLHRLRCPQCASETRAALPADVPRGAFGARLQAAVVTLAVRNRVSRRDAAELVRELFGCRLASGTIDAIVQGAGAALEEPHARLRDHVRSAPAVNIEKTGWRTAGERRTLQGRAQRAGGALPQRRGSPPPRGPGAARRGVRGDRLLGPLVGLSTTSTRSDASSALAHLARDFTAHSEGLGAQKDFGAAGLEIAAGLFAAWGEFRGDADRARLLERIDPLKQELRALLAQAAERSARNRRQRSFAKNLLKRWPALWSFASVPGVEPTNNHAERGLRGAVIYRKLSLGSHSEEGERIVERLLSASVTCRLQGRSLFAYLSDVLAAKIRGDPIPLLA